VCQIIRFADEMLLQGKGEGQNSAGKVKGSHKDVKLKLSNPKFYVFLKSFFQISATHVVREARSFSTLFLSSFSHVPEPNVCHGGVLSGVAAELKKEMIRN
jgi:hypothetical protein